MPDNEASFPEFSMQNVSKQKRKQDGLMDIILTN